MQTLTQFVTRTHDWKCEIIITQKYEMRICRFYAAVKLQRANHVDVLVGVVCGCGRAVFAHGGHQTADELLVKFLGAQQQVT